MKDFKNMTPQEREEFMDAMTEADRIHDYYKTHERPLPLKKQILEYQNKKQLR